MAVQTPYNPAFFCDWELEQDLFLAAQADYDAGNRRSLNAWNAINDGAPPGSHFLKRGKCWHGALLYLGVFGSRAELPGLMQLIASDSIQAGETTDPTTRDGISNLGEARSLALRLAYQAIGAQVGRQLIFDGRLDAHGQMAERMLLDCALDVARCSPGTAMHIYRRQRLQRHAVRGLGIARTPSTLNALRQIESSLASLDGLMPYAVGNAQYRERQISSNLSYIQSEIPQP